MWAGVIALDTLVKANVLANRGVLWIKNDNTKAFKEGVLALVKERAYTLLKAAELLWGPLNRKTTTNGKINIKKGYCLLRKTSEVKPTYIPQNEDVGNTTKLLPITLNLSVSGGYRYSERRVIYPL